MLKDPYMLLSFINTKLRDNYADLSSLCEDLDLVETEVILTLEKIDYYYNLEENRFIRR